jgi:predicted protein tyrosine phosphatase
MKLLFVRSRNRRRSLTAETLFARYPAIEALSAGTSPDAETPASSDLIEWADIVMVMESPHGRRLNRSFPAQPRDKRLMVLGIPDDYDYMDPELVHLLEAKLLPHLEIGTAPPAE